jgi:hypothetical protein
LPGTICFNALVPSEKLEQGKPAKIIPPRGEEMLDEKIPKVRALPHASHRPFGQIASRK